MYLKKNPTNGTFMLFCVMIIVYSQHINGTGANHTKIHKPTGLVYYEMFDDENSAILREKYFKSGSGREWLKNKLAGDK